MRFHVEFVQLRADQANAQKQLDIVKNDGMQFRMVHLCDDWVHVHIRGLRTLIPGLKTVETEGSF